MRILPARKPTVSNHRAAGVNRIREAASATQRAQVRHRGADSKEGVLVSAGKRCCADHRAAIVDAGRMTIAAAQVADC